MLDVSRHGRVVLIRVLGWAIDERRGGVMAKRGVGSSSCHGGTLLMGVKRRVRGRNVGGKLIS